MTDLVYILLATNVATVVGFTIAIYKLVAQLSSKIISPNINTYKVAERKAPDVPKTPRERQELPGRPISSDSLIAIDEADPNDVMRSLAVQSGRLDEFTPMDEEA